MGRHVARGGTRRRSSTTRVANAKAPAASSSSAIGPSISRRCAGRVRAIRAPLGEALARPMLYSLHPGTSGGSSAKMGSRWRRYSMRHVIAILAAVVLLPVLADAQTPERTAWGDPDLQGVWTNRTTTPLERPSEFEGRTELSAEERADLDAQAEANRDRPPPPGRTGAYNSFWLDRGLRRTRRRSSSIRPTAGIRRGRSGSGSPTRRSRRRGTARSSTPTRT